MSKTLYKEPKLEEIVKIIYGTGKVGYTIGKTKLSHNSLKILLAEENLNMKIALEDFEISVNDTLSRLPYIVDINFNYKGNYIILSGDRTTKLNLRRSKIFLEAYKTILENYHK